MLQTRWPTRGRGMPRPYRNGSQQERQVVNRELAFDQPDGLAGDAQLAVFISQHVLAVSREGARLATAALGLAHLVDEHRRLYGHLLSVSVLHLDVRDQVGCPGRWVLRMAPRVLQLPDAVLQ